MLVLSRSTGESIVLSTRSTPSGEETIIATITVVSNGRCKLGIEAPQEVRILRGELERWPQAKAA